MNFVIRKIFLILAISILISPVSAVLASSKHDVDSPTALYLPIISNGVSLASAPQASALFFDLPSDEMNLANGSFPVIWFGEVRNTENYVDVRVAYNREELYLRLHVFDRRCWYDRYAPFDEPTQWDAAAIYLNLTGNVGSVPTPQTYRFVAQFDYYPKPPDETKTDVYRGNGSGWSPIEVPFTLISSYTGHEPNDDGDDRGWTAVIRIPFSSLGLQEMPNTGSIWGLSIVNYDRDDANGATVDYKTWPRSPDFNQPASWGQLRFGYPTYNPPPGDPSGTTYIRQGLNNAIVSDASAGGYAVCGAGTDFWETWGDTNESFYNDDLSDFNVQNQGNVADWPCFSKVYVSFPLDQVPAGKKILSATLKMHIWGAAGPYPKPGSLIHVYTISEPWNEFTLTWNNAPYIERYIDQTWVATITTDPGFPGIPVEWNVTSAVAESYNNGNSVDLVLYSSDNWRHSGKYFSSSNTGDWNKEGRPLLTVVWSD